MTTSQLKGGEVMLTVERLRELLIYDPDTGIFTWKVYRARGARAGNVAGSITDQGYIEIGVDGQSRKAHILAWLYVHGVWPEGDLDHENEIKTDNRISNLRRANRSQNMQNRSNPKSTNQSGYLGVHYDSTRSKWMAHIQIEGKHRYLGGFNTPEEASEAYLAAKRELHTFWAGGLT